MTDYFDRLEGHLLDAVERQAQSRSTRRPAGFRASRGRTARLAARWVLAAASVLAVALVVAGALLIAGGGSNRHSAARGAASSSRAELIRLLGVLRTPQTSADRAFDHAGWPTPPRAPGSRIEPDRALVRLATVTPWGARVFIVPLTSPTNRVLARELGETVALWVQGIGWSDYSTVSAVETGLAWGPGATVRGPHGWESRFFEIVPDGVARVVFYPPPDTPSPYRGSVTANVHNNVAVFREKVAEAGAYPVRAAWYAATGRLIKRVGDWNLLATLRGPFPFAPQTQAGQWAGGAGPCPLAAPNPYLPRRSGCVSAAVAHVNGRSDLIILYAQLGSQRVGTGFLPTAFSLKVVRGSGAALSTQISTTGASFNPAIILVRDVNDHTGAEILVHDAHLSSGEFVGVYTLNGHGPRLAGTFAYGGDSGQQYGFTCHEGRNATITQHQFLLETGGANALWQQTDAVFTWIGSSLKRTSQHTSHLHGSRDVGGLGFPPTSLTSVNC